VREVAAFGWNELDRGRAFRIFPIAVNPA
jgi:hypothetical protein